MDPELSRKKLFGIAAFLLIVGKLLSACATGAPIPSTTIGAGSAKNPESLKPCVVIIREDDTSLSISQTLGLTPHETVNNNGRQVGIGTDPLVPGTTIGVNEEEHPCRQ